MSQQFYKKTPPRDPKIYLPGRTQEVFPSGLIKITRNYACLPSEVVQRSDSSFNVVSVRDQLKSGQILPDKNQKSADPSGGPIIIFPDATEIKRADGMVEFRATAYGRRTTSFNITQSDVRGVCFQSFRNEFTGVDFQSFNTSALNRQYIVRGVLQTAEGLDTATVAPPGLAPIVRPAIFPPGASPFSQFIIGYGDPLKEGVVFFNEFSNFEDGFRINYQESIIDSVSLILQNLESTNFGAYTEFAATWISTANRDTKTIEISRIPVDPS
jgi:hypothetical protein